jgi:hypothetical protein
MFGVFGNTLAEAKRSEFFVWFHLTEESNETRDGVPVRTFRPTSSQFNSLVAVEMTIDAHDKIARTALRIQRAFIDHAESSNFAGDITKSFLIAALNPPDIELIEDAAIQIRAHEPAGARMTHLNLRGKAPAPLAPGEGEPEYFTYSGKRRQFRRVLETLILEMANLPESGVEWLKITIGPK